jgi:hypothetical protein
VGTDRKSDEWKDRWTEGQTDRTAEQHPDLLRFHALLPVTQARAQTVSGKSAAVAQLQHARALTELSRNISDVQKEARAVQARGLGFRV